jgi:hypothetical protein
VDVGKSPVMPNEYATLLVPEPKDASDALFAGERVPKVSLQVPGLVVEYRKCANVPSPLGFAEPFNVAELAVVALADEVTTDGCDGVVKLTTEPNDSPAEFCAIAQK